MRTCYICRSEYDHTTNKSAVCSFACRELRRQDPEKYANPNPVVQGPPRIQSSQGRELRTAATTKTCYNCNCPIEIGERFEPIMVGRYESGQFVRYPRAVHPELNCGVSKYAV